MATKDYSSKQEKMIAYYLNWRVVSGSGAAPCVPGDVISYSWLGECKTHTSEKADIAFLDSWWQKIKEEAIVKHRNPVLFVDNGTQKADCTWCLFSLATLNGKVHEEKSLKIKKNAVNVKFNHLEMRREYRRMNTDRDVIIVFTSKIGKSNPDEIVGILPLEVFASLFEER